MVSFSSTGGCCVGVTVLLGILSTEAKDPVTSVSLGLAPREVLLRVTPDHNQPKGEHMGLQEQYSGLRLVTCMQYVHYYHHLNQKI